MRSVLLLLSLAVGCSAANKTATYSLALSGTVPVAALQFDLATGSTGTVTINLPDKTVQCNQLASGPRCIVSGLNQTQIPNGTVGKVTVIYQGKPPAKPVLNGFVAASPDGNDVTASNALTIQ